MYHNLGLYDLSLKNYEKAIDSTNNLPISKYIRIASILIGRGSYEDCFSYLGKIDKKFSSSYSVQNEKELLILKAEVLLASGKNSESTKILRSLVEKYPLEGKALILLAKTAWNEKDYEVARLYFDRASKIKEWEVESLIEHGRMLVEIRKYEDAVILLEKAQLIDPQPRVKRFLESIRNLLISSNIQL